MDQLAQGHPAWGQPKRTVLHLLLHLGRRCPKEPENMVWDVNLVGYGHWF